MLSADLCGYGYLAAFGSVFQGIADQIVENGINLVAVNPNFFFRFCTYKLEMDVLFFCI